MKKLSIIFLLTSTLSFAQNEVLEQKIQEIINSKNATIGVSITKFDDNYNLNINGDKMLPMLSVFKFHIALTTLDLVDQGKLNLNQKITINKSDLVKNTWSPIREKYPNGVKMPLNELIYYSVAESDNPGTDVLLKLIGGTETVQKFINSKGIKDFSIKADETQMHKGYEYMYWNKTTANEANLALQLFYDEKILSKESTDFLMNIMRKTNTGTNKIVAFLPKNTYVAHKTGSSGKDEKGMTVAENDIAIIKLPNGKPYALSVFVSDSMENEETNTRIVADISKLVWDDFNK